MSLREDIRTLYLHGQEKYLRNLSVDCVIFGFHKAELRVLLLKAGYAKEWALPGGFIMQDEHMDDSAKRILHMRTGLDKIYLQQFHVFSDPGRSTKKINQAFLRNVGLEMTRSWMFERFITVGYSALVDFTKVVPVPDSISESCSWFAVNRLPLLILDHGIILKAALDHLRLQLNFQPIGYNLLEERFTMPELQKLYETILNRKLDRRNFQRKIVATGILKKLPERKAGVAHRAPFYYKFDLVKYRRALRSGLGFDL